MICPIMSALVLVGGEHRVGSGSEDPDQSSRYENVRQLVPCIGSRCALWYGMTGQATPIYGTCSLALGPDRDDADFFPDPAYKETTE